jgi:superfamily I DNA/RNA helicase
MLIGELIPEALKYMRNNPAAPDRRAFDHVLVDEYQDLNRAEQELLDLISERGSLSIVGDEDQSIYSFKYAHPEGISQFATTHAGTHDEDLTECRRCPRLVVDLANDLISHNRQRTNRALQSGSNCGEGEVFVVQWDDMDREVQGISDFIKSRIDRGLVDYPNVLVLAPRRQLGYAIRDALNAKMVFARSFFYEEALDGDPKDINDSAAQQAFSLLVLLENPEDRTALRCSCGFGSSTLSKGAWLRLREKCNETSRSPRQVLEALASGQEALPHSAHIVDRYRILRQKQVGLAGLRGEGLLDALFPESDTWACPIRTLVKDMTEVDDQLDAPRLRSTLLAAITQPELPTDVSYVRVMSLHKSKGITADMVIVVGCIEGLIPSIPRGVSTADALRALEEQRRLFYVAVTRARQTLVLSSEVSLPWELAHRMGALVPQLGSKTHVATIASRFVSELGPSCPRPVAGTEMPD